MHPNLTQEFNELRCNMGSTDKLCSFANGYVPSIHWVDHSGEQQAIPVITLQSELKTLLTQCDALQADLAVFRARYERLRDEFRSSNWYAKFFLLSGKKFDAAIDDILNKK